LPAEAKEVLRRLADGVSGGQVSPAVTVVNVDGQPAEVKSEAFRPDAEFADVLAGQRTAFVEGVEQEVAGVRAKAAQVDDLAALEVAGRAAHVGGGTGTVILIDSGVQTVAPLDFRQDGLLDAQPADLTHFLKKNGRIPHLDGLTVFFDGLGDVAEPQKPLGQPQRVNLVELYTQIAREGQAKCVAIMPEQRIGPSPSNVPQVGLAPVSPAPRIDLSSGSAILPDSGEVGFIPDEAEFRDEQAATNALRPISEWLKENATGSLALVGTTARWKEPAGQKRLSEQRAEKVRSTLIALGADGNRISAKGAGSYFDGYVPDLDADGNLIPGPAQKNRKVMVTASRK
jgi:outer membrane protein OmpA-like peptidoglycan-associated protein